MIFKLPLPYRQRDQRDKEEKVEVPLCCPLTNPTPLPSNHCQQSGLGQWLQSGLGQLEPLPGIYTPTLAHTLTTMLNRWDHSTPILQVDFF